MGAVGDGTGYRPDSRADAPQPARDPTNREGERELKKKVEAIVLVAMGGGERSGRSWCR